MVANSGNRSQIRCTESGSNKPKPLPSVATSCRSDHMVRRGSTVRVRQRALQKRRIVALFRSDGLAPSPTCGAYGAVYGSFGSRTVSAKGRARVKHVSRHSKPARQPAGALRTGIFTPRHSHVVDRRVPDPARRLVALVRGEHGAPLGTRIGQGSNAGGSIVRVLPPQQPERCVRGRRSSELPPRRYGQGPFAIAELPW